MNSPLGGVKPSRDWLCCPFDNPYPPPPLSHDWCVVRTASFFHFGGHVDLFKPSYEQGCVGIQNRCHMDLWSARLVLTNHHLNQQQLPLHQTPRETVSWLLFQLSLCLFMVPNLIGGSSENLALQLASAYVAITRTIWPEKIKPGGPLS